MARTSGMSDEEYHRHCLESRARAARNREWRRLHPYWRSYHGQDNLAPTFRLGETVYWRGLRNERRPYSCTIYEGKVIGVPPRSVTPFANDMHLGRYVVLPVRNYYGVGREVAEFLFNDELVKDPDNIVHHVSMGNYYPGLDANFTSE